MDFMTERSFDTQEELQAYRKERCAAIEENLKVIRGQIAEAAVKSGRNPEDVRLMAVTKTVDEYFINYAIDHCGIDLIGENKVQEMLRKKPLMHMDGVEPHLIGHLQTNKVRQIVGEVDLIESVDSVKLAKEISKQSVKRDLNTGILLEVNVGEEESKTGLPYEQILDVAAEISELPGLTIRGLMAIPPICDDEAVLRGYFSKMRDLFIDIKSKKMDNSDISILSMGMSSDYVPAILEGSTEVRVGTSIFGGRIY